MQAPPLPDSSYPWQASIVKNQGGLSGPLAQMWYQNSVCPWARPQQEAVDGRAPQNVAGC